jgi:hypothetical protein
MSSVHITLSVKLCGDIKASEDALTKPLQHLPNKGQFDWTAWSDGAVTKVSVGSCLRLSGSALIDRLWAAEAGHIRGFETGAVVATAYETMKNKRVVDLKVVMAMEHIQECFSRGRGVGPVTCGRECQASFGRVAATMRVRGRNTRQ